MSLLPDPLKPYAETVRAGIMVCGLGLLLASLGGAYWLGSRAATTAAQKTATALALETERHAAVISFQLAAEKAKKQSTVTVEVVRYVEKAQNLPGTAVVRGRLDRVCDATAEARAAPGGVRSATGAAELPVRAAAPDPDDGLVDRPGITLDGIAADARNVALNRDRLALCSSALKTIYENRGN